MTGGVCRSLPRRAARACAVVGLACAVAFGALAAGCAGEAPTVRKIAIIGVDGMDWGIADPLMEQGRLPNLEALVRRGAKVDLRSTGPVMKSPVIWTTIATGKGKDKHGITDYVGAGKDSPLFTSQGWKARPIWEILGDRGYTVGIVNWLVNWPAKPVNGYNVSDRIMFAPEDGFEASPDAAYPAGLEDELAPARQPAAETGDEIVARFLNGDSWRSSEDGFTSEAVEAVRRIYAADQSVYQVTAELLRTREQPDLLAVYMNGVDVSCHAFWGQMEPSSVDISMTDEFVETFKDVIPRYYERMDALIGELVGLLEEGTTVIVCSDHGFRGPHRSESGLKLGIWMHREVGVLAAAGPGIRRSAAAEGSVFDITPTILALFGEPVARDMDGFVLSEILDERLLEHRPVTYVATYEDEGGGEAESPVESPVDEEIKERLRSLGYIE